MKRYTVKDSYGNVVRVFFSYASAMNFKQAYGNAGWYII